MAYLVTDQICVMEWKFIKGKAFVPPLPFYRGPKFDDTGALAVSATLTHNTQFLGTHVFIIIFCHSDLGRAILGYPSPTGGARVP